jgi:ABC-type sugar transport system substrate-binding protein
MALGVIEALRAAGKLESVPVVGVDAIRTDRLVKKGEMMGTVLQDADKLGRTLCFSSST